MHGHVRAGLFVGCYTWRANANTDLGPGDIGSRYSTGTAGQREGCSFNGAEYLRAVLNGGNHCKHRGKEDAAEYFRLHEYLHLVICTMHFFLFTLG